MKPPPLSRMKLTDYIRNPELLDAAAVEELGQLIERHPYFQVARLLFLRGLYQLQDERFGPALREAAIYVPDRTKLFQLIEGYKFQLEPELRHRHVQQPEEPVIDRTQSLIESFLAKNEETTKPQKPKVVDVSTDYMAYLEQLEDLPVQSDTGTDIIDEFMDRTGGRIVLSQDTSAEGRFAPSSEASSEGRDEDGDVADDISTEETTLEAETDVSDDYFTETLARIYVKQGKYNKAIEIIRRINLNYPKKSTYFADQIRFLEKLALNERYKKDPISDSES